TWTGNGIETPDFFARLRIERGEEPSYRAVSTSGSDDNLVFDHKWGMRHRVTRRGGDRRVPKQIAGLRADRDQVRVQRSHIKRVAKYRQSAIDTTATGARSLRDVVAECPELTAGGRVKSHNLRVPIGIVRIVGSLDRVEDAVEHERCRFEFFE